MTIASSMLPQSFADSVARAPQRLQDASTQPLAAARRAQAPRAARKPPTLSRARGSGRATMKAAAVRSEERVELQPLQQELQQQGLEAGAEPGPGQQEPSGPSDWRMTALLFLFPALGGALFGYDIGATSGALVSIKSPEFSGTTWFALGSFQSGLVVSASLLGALFTSGATIFVGDRMGRRKELLLAAALYGGGAVAMGAAPNLGTLLFGRILYGTRIGFAMHAAPAYIAESTPPQVRGLLISLKECLVVMGILLGYALSYVWAEEVGGWRLLYGSALLPAVALLFGMAWLPDSPRWLLLSGQRSEARAALQRCRGSASSGRDLDVECRAMEQSLEGGRGQSSGVAAVLEPRYRRPLAVGLSLVLFQQITGQPSVLYYAAEIFERAGFGAGRSADSVAVWLGAFKLAMTGVAAVTVHRIGRRPLLLGGIAGVLAALLALGAAQGGAGAGSAAALTSVAALLLYVGAYQVSFGPISWLMVGEIFPLAVRGSASGLATLTNFGSNFLVSLVLPALQDTLGPGGTYFSFAALAALALGVVFTIVPETKGKSLEEIEAMFSSASGSSSSGGKAS